MINVGVIDDLCEPKPHEQDMTICEQGTCFKIANEHRITSKLLATLAEQRVTSVLVITLRS